MAVKTCRFRGLHERTKQVKRAGSGDIPHKILGAMWFQPLNMTLPDRLRSGPKRSCGPHWSEATPNVSSVIARLLILTTQDCWRYRIGSGGSTRMPSEPLPGSCDPRPVRAGEGSHLLLLSSPFFSPGIHDLREHMLIAFVTLVAIAAIAGTVAPLLMEVLS